MCGVEVPRGTKQCPVCRRFIKGTTVSVTSTLVAKNLPPDFALLAADVDRFVSGCLVDEDDANDVPTRRRALLEYRARVHRRIVLLDAAIERRGLFDGRGQLRALWLQRLEGLINVAARLDAQLGLARRQKRVSFSDYVEQHYGANAAPAAPVDAGEATASADDVPAVATPEAAGEPPIASEGE